MEAILLEKIRSAADAKKEKVFQIEKTIWDNPETGYREWKTSAYLQGLYREMDFTPVPAGNIPGFYCDLDTGKPGPMIALIGELDAILCPEHPSADPATGAVHACGHHAQSAALAGAASVLKDPEILERLSGKIRFISVPAEELIEIEYREELRKKGTIRYFGGKVEFLYRGFFDGVSAVVMLHTGGGRKSFSLSPGSLGCLLKKIEFTGKASHAGATPHLGINALYAANMALNAINSIRETFRDEDHIRVHPIITTAPGAVNVIPGRVTMESYVRGATLQAIKAANRQVNRALAGAAASMGASVMISDRPGYMPLDNDRNLYTLSKKIMTSIAGDENVRERGQVDKGSTDMGDISCVIPSIHPSGSGAKGTGHGINYVIDDPYSACLLAAEYLAAAAASLLENNALEALRVSAERKLKFNSFQDYFNAIDSLNADCDAVGYHDDGSITIKLP